MTIVQKRPIHAIARDIKREWKNVYFGAVPYLDAMLDLSSSADNYGADSGQEIVLYFLSNANAFRGPKAKSLKAELKEHMGQKLEKADREALANWRNSVLTGEIPEPSGWVSA